jgi:hypothetical protein
MRLLLTKNKDARSLYFDNLKGKDTNSRLKDKLIKLYEKRREAYTEDIPSIYKIETIGRELSYYLGNGKKIRDLKNIPGRFLSLPTNIKTRALETIAN